MTRKKGTFFLAILLGQKYLKKQKIQSVSQNITMLMLKGIDILFIYSAIIKV